MYWAINSFSAPYLTCDGASTDMSVPLEERGTSPAPISSYQHLLDAAKHAIAWACAFAVWYLCEITAFVWYELISISVSTEFVLAKASFFLLTLYPKH